MSVLFLPPSAGAASVPDASETVKGKIRIATSAEATAGTDDLTSMTPLKVKSVVDAAVVGGVTYQGTIDASSPADLSNASKGDLYIISVAGSYQGQDWAVGDHLLINADMGGTLDPNKIDKVDNTDSVTSVAGRTGAVVLSASDISGLATVATSGAYSDLSGLPTLGTAAALDVGTSANNVVQLDGTAKLPAVDGSQLTNVSATVAALDDIGDVTITTPANGEALVYNSTSGEWENGTVSATVAALDDIGDVDVTGAVATNVLKYDGANWVDGSVAYSEVTGTPSLATIATTGDYSDLNDSVVVQQFNTTATASAISSNALHVFRFYGAGGFTLTLSAATAFNGFALFNNISGSDVIVNGGTFRANGEGSTGGSSSITVKAGERRLYYVEGASLYLEANSTLIGHNADVTITSPSNGEALVYNSTSGLWENSTVSASVAALDDIGNVDTTGAVATNVLKYDGANWVDGSVAYSEVTGTPTLGTAAALDVGTGANNVVQLNGSAQLPAVDGSLLTNVSATVAALNDIGDVSAAAPNNGDVIAYNSTSGDWEAAAQSISPPIVAIRAPSTNQTLNAPSEIEEVYIYTPLAAITVTLVAPGTAGSGFKYQIKNRGTFALTLDAGSGVTIDGSQTFVLSVSESAVTLITDGNNWFII